MFSQSLQKVKRHIRDGVSHDHAFRPQGSCIDIPGILDSFISLIITSNHIAIIFAP